MRMSSEHALSLCSRYCIHMVKHVAEAALALARAKTRSSTATKVEVAVGSSGIGARELALVILLLAGFANAQTSQFLFDDNGNLAAQIAATNLPPQIIGQPQNQTVAPGETARFSVIVTDPRGLSYEWRHD